MYVYINKKDVKATIQYIEVLQIKGDRGMYYRLHKNRRPVYDKNGKYIGAVSEEVEAMTDEQLDAIAKKFKKGKVRLNIIGHSLDVILAITMIAAFYRKLNLTAEAEGVSWEGITIFGKTLYGISNLAWFISFLVTALIFTTVIRKICNAMNRRLSTYSHYKN